MDRTIGMLIIGLIFGGGIGFVIAAGNGITFDGHDHGENLAHSSQSAEHGHDHSKTLSVPSGANPPSLKIEVTPDPMSGWNLHVMPSNFRFSPENASKAHVEGEGHAHVYVNGRKLARLYGSWMHLDHLPAGDVTIRVTLNTNDHLQLAVDGKPVMAEAVVSNKH